MQDWAESHLAGKFRLSEGTALGALRNGTFISWDDDVDIGLWHSDRVAFEQHALPRLQTVGFSVSEVERQRCGRPAFFVALLRKGEKIDLDFVGENMDCKANSSINEAAACRSQDWGNSCKFTCKAVCDDLLPFLSELAPLNFAGVEFMCPQAGYMQYLYGDDWREPRPRHKPRHTKPVSE
jgi:hypothetical protein